MKYTNLLLAAVAMTTVSAINKNDGDDSGLHKTTQSKYDENGNEIKDEEAELVYNGKGSGAANLGAISLATAFLIYAQ